MIVPIHNHSMYSALDGFSTPEEIAQRCVEIEAPACGITDHGVVSGHLHIAKAFAAHDVKPIFGCELYHGTKTTFKGRELDQAHLVALAKTDEGLRNLWRLTNLTAQQDHFHNVGRVFWSDLEKYSEGLIVTSSCLAGLIPQGLLQGDYEPLERYLNIFGSNFIIELHTYDSPEQEVVNRALADIAFERGIAVVFATDAHYAFPDQYIYHDLYLALQTGQNIFTPPEERKMHHGEGNVVMLDEASIRQRLRYLPEQVVDEAINNSVSIGEQVSANLPQVKRHLPMFVPADCPWLNEKQKERTPEELFVDLVEHGIYERYGSAPAPEVWERALYEMEALLNDEIHHYFLLGWDQVQFVKSAEIPMGPGRGSSAGSIVAYALGITDIDPLEYGLIFERFWNPGRAKGFPDIDSDFSRYRRGEVIQYLKKRWGEDKVCAIGTVGYMKPKSTVDKLATGCGITPPEAAELKKIIGKTTKIEILGHEQIGWSRKYEPGKVYYVNDDVGDEIQKWINADPKRSAIRELFIDFCEACCSRVQQYGVHASGIVISDVPLADQLPAYRRGGKGDDGIPATQFAMTDVDNRGFVKLDVLGLRTLDVLEFWRLMMQEQDNPISWAELDAKDKEYAWTYELLTLGFTAGIFQVEDGYGKQLCKRLEPRSIDDMAVINALNRPGPIQASIPDQYIDRKNGTIPVTYIHPRVEELIGDNWGPTYGLLIYQEQLIEYFNRLGYTLSESDAVRKILGKKKPDQLHYLHDGLGEWKNRGYLTMSEQKGIPKEVAEEIWKEFEGYADYSFNKPHAVSYGKLGSRTVKAKGIEPGAFYAAVMRSLDRARDQKKRETILPEIITECRRLNVPIKPPDIRYSKQEPHLDSTGAVRFGFKDIKGIGQSGDYIVYLRDEVGLDISSPEAFKQAIEEYNAVFLEQAPEDRVGQRSPKQQLGAGKINALEGACVWADMGQEISLTERQKREQEYIGVIITDNTREVIERNHDMIGNCDEYEEVLRPWREKAVDPEPLTYHVCGIVANIQEKRRKADGKPYGLLVLEYQGEQIEALVSTYNWRSFKRLFSIRSVGIFTIRQFPPDERGESYLYMQGKRLQ